MATRVPITPEQQAAIDRFRNASMGLLAAQESGNADAIAAAQREQDEALAAREAAFGATWATAPAAPDDDDTDVLTAERAAGYDEGFKIGFARQTARIRAILTCPEAEGRRSHALRFALETDLPVDQAKGLLATLPVEAAEAPQRLAIGPVPSILERASKPVPFGGGPFDGARDPWNKVTSKINGTPEASTKPSAGPPSPEFAGYLASWNSGNGGNK